MCIFAILYWGVIFDALTKLVRTFRNMYPFSMILVLLESREWELSKTTNIALKNNIHFSFE